MKPPVKECHLIFLVWFSARVLFSFGARCSTVGLLRRHGIRDESARAGLQPPVGGRRVLDNVPEG